MNDLKFKQDAGLTTAFALLSSAQAIDGSAAAVDRVAYLGSVLPAVKYLATIDPGVAPILVSIVDAVTGLQLPGSTIRLALTEAGLDVATPGADLAVGAEILSGSANAVEVWIRIDAAAAAAGLYDNLSLVTSETVEVPV
jgi:hypothetical protein